MALSIPWPSQMKPCFTTEHREAAINCSDNQTPCGRTCLSLSNMELECYPIDGCNCPLGLYLNNKRQCVPKSQCPCYLDANTIVMPNQQTTFNGLTCYCVSGRLSCIGKPMDFEETCMAPKVMKTCGSLSDKFGAACAPTCQLLATGIRCVPTKCEAGCVCPAGTYEDLDGSCVEESDCSCEYGGIIYRSGESMFGDCQSCTCSGGQWHCEETPNCSSTCMMFGESHIKTFDGQQYLFDGNCEYTLVTDGCRLNTLSSSFKIVTENVICGTTGATCARSMTATIGNTELKLFDGKYTISHETPDVDIVVQNNTLYIMFDITIPDKFYISLTWNKNMNLFIKILKLGKESVCGLCGNYNGNINDDFETRSKYVASTQLEFINSWKDRPTCMDVNAAVDPCGQNPQRKSWGEKSCQVLKSKPFEACNKVVNHQKYFQACLNDACACDTGGEWECLCEAVQAYAAACLSAGICVDWRTPDFCPEPSTTTPVPSTAPTSTPTSTSSTIPASPSLSDACWGLGTFLNSMPSNTRKINKNTTNIFNLYIYFLNNKFNYHLSLTINNTCNSYNNFNYYYLYTKNNTYTFNTPNNFNYHYSLTFFISYTDH
ncbi:mucin-6-like [Bufo bufo]|uniref:mucin-6-like n=1 Tax=Bufo bufo TaxID=8384 RepID=UPI001ABE42D0|nr:mucin-6-like [Bufo bufo]